MKIESSSQRDIPPVPTSRSPAQNSRPGLSFSRSSLNSSPLSGLRSVSQNVLSFLSAIIKWIKNFFYSTDYLELKPNSQSLLVKETLELETNSSLLKKTPISLFYSIPEITIKQRENLLFIFEILANNSKMKIARQILSVDRAKNNVKNIHPLRFLEYALHPSKRPLLQKISSRKEFKIGEQFQEELIDHLKSHVGSKDFPIHLQGFVESLYLSYKLTKDYNFIHYLVEINQWKELLDYLINK